MNLSLLLTAALCLPVVSYAQEARPSQPPPRSLVVGPQSSRPWALSLDERVAKRAAAESHAGRRGAHASTAAAVPFRLDGALTPELFFPFELFTQLVPQASSDSPGSARVRAAYNEHVLSLGWNPDSFWRDIVNLTSDYRAAT